MEDTQGYAMELRNSRKISSSFSYLPARCRGEPYVRPRTNNVFVPMYDGRTQGSPLHVLGIRVLPVETFCKELNMP
jgi:hypothetical protein